MAINKCLHRACVRACVCVCVGTTPFIKYLRKIHRFFFTIFLPRELLWSSSHVMTDRFYAHVKSCHRMNSCWPRREPPRPSSCCTRGGVFPRNHVQQQETGAERGAQCHRFVLLLLVLMVTGLKTRAAAATESKTGQSLPGEPPATDGAGTHGKATSTPGQSRVGWGLPPLC